MYQRKLFIYFYFIISKEQRKVVEILVLNSENQNLVQRVQNDLIVPLPVNNHGRRALDTAQGLQMLRIRQVPHTHRAVTRPAQQMSVLVHRQRAQPVLVRVNHLGELARLGVPHLDSLLVRRADHLALGGQAERADQRSVSVKGPYCCAGAQAPKDDLVRATDHHIRLSRVDRERPHRTLVSLQSAHLHAPDHIRHQVGRQSYRRVLVVPMRPDLDSGVVGRTHYLVLVGHEQGVH